MEIRPRAALRFLAAMTTSVLVVGAGAGAGAVQGAEIVRLRSGALAGTADTAGLKPEMRISARDLDRGGPALLLFDAGITRETREAAARKGIRLSIYVGHHAYVGFLPVGGLATTTALPGLVWAAPYHPGLKIAPDLFRTDADADADAALVLTVELFPHVDAEAVVFDLKAIGVEVLGVLQGRPRLGRLASRPGRIVIATSVLEKVATVARVAHLPETLWIDRKPHFDFHNGSSAWVGQSGIGQSFATPLHDHGLFGEGQIIGQLDSGVDVDSCFFRDPVVGPPAVNEGLGVGTPDPQHRKILIYNFLWAGDNPANPSDWDDFGHGTHTAGSAAGDDLATPGTRDPHDGMAPQAKLVVQDSGFASTPCGMIPIFDCPVTDLYPFFDQAFQQGARIHTNSYGSSNVVPLNKYSLGSESADRFNWDHPEFFLTFSAGNNGPAGGTVGSPGTAKNVVTVGATYYGSHADALSSSSSRGPTLDGRTKPDLTAPGFGVVSAANDGSVNTNNCGTAILSGTSVSAPTVAGFAALVREYFDKGFYPTGVSNPADGFAPSGALLKATLIASATSMARLATPAPSNEQGWGRPVLDRALYFSGDPGRLFVHDESGGFDWAADPVDAHTVEVLDPGEALRVVLVWTDYPSSPLATVNLVNDLNLEVESPGGTIYLGNVFLAGASVPGGAADALNNVEVVHVAAPEPGSWTIRVRPQAIPQSGQGYALVVTGRLPAAGVLLERTALVLDDSFGGNGDGVLEPGEWIDLPLTLLNGSDTQATNVRAEVESLTAGVVVIVPSAGFADLQSAQQDTSEGPHLRIRLTAGFDCTAEVRLRFRYLADGYVRVEETGLPSGNRAIFLVEDFEGATAWQHSATESDASRGNWTLGDPDGTGFQPEDDATADPGVQCFYTAPNPQGGAGIGTDDVDGGVVVARSGTYDLSNRHDARVSLSRWFGHRDVGEDPNDYFRLEIQESSLSSDVLLEELDHTRNQPQWIEVTFRVADFITPGSEVRLKAKAQDGFGPGSVIEAAIDEITFWEPECDVHDPPPNPLDTLTLQRSEDDIALAWLPPPLDPAHGETAVYEIYRSTTVPEGFEVLHTNDADEQTYDDLGAALGPDDLYYLVIATNAAGSSGTLP